MKNALVIGGSSGIGLAVATELLKRKYNHIYIADINEPKVSALSSELKQEFEDKTSFIKLDLFKKKFDPIKNLDIDTLIFTAGFGRAIQFEELSETEINKLIEVNMSSAIKVIKLYFDKIKSKNDFYTAVMVSICGHITSPLFSVYGAAKSGLAAFIKSVNAELAAEGYSNRILDVSPGSLKGTSFTGKENNLTLLGDIPSEILNHALNKATLYIPQYDEVYKNIIEKDRSDSLSFGIESYKYKVDNNRIDKKPQIVIGYLSGTFDLFHIGHLNLLKRAKEQCDYLIVGVHESGSWKGKETFIPFEERLAIVEACEYVDEAHMSLDEDSDAWDLYHFNKLFVGSDYQGSERFMRYEGYFKDKGVQIVYFPYTKGTSSTQLREKLSKK